MDQADSVLSRLPINTSANNPTGAPESLRRSENDDQEIEPSLGWTDYESRWGRIANPTDIDAELDKSDDEPNLGSIEDHPNGYLDGSDFGRDGRSQERCASGNSDDRGDDCDRELSLGWTESGQKDNWDDRKLQKLCRPAAGQNGGGTQAV
jgi:hypothetical protein